MTDVMLIHAGMAAGAGIQSYRLWTRLRLLPAEQCAGAQVRACRGEAAQHCPHDVDRVHLIGRHRSHAKAPRRAASVGSPHVQLIGRFDSRIQELPSVGVE